MVLFVRALDPVRQIELQAGVALAAIIDVADDGHRVWALSARIENRVKLPVQASPREKMIFALEFAFVAAQHDIGFCKVTISETRDRVFQDFRLKQGADGEQFFDVGG